MPKTTKRSTSKRAERIAKAHATEPPKIEIKAPQRQRTPGHKQPTSGIARYPWAVFTVLAIIALGFSYLYFNKIGPFAPPPTPPKKEVVSACLDQKVLKNITNTNPAPGQETFNKTTHTYKEAPAMTIDETKIYCAGINTNRGLIVVELDPKLAPKTVNNFVFLAQNHFYDGMVFHRVVPNTYIQTGDPKGNDPKERGKGGPGYTIEDEPVQGDYKAGGIAMARMQQPNTSGSQFFIFVEDNSTLPKEYNLFGKVVQGMDVVKKIQGPGGPSDQGVPQDTPPDLLNYVVVVPAS